MLLLGLVENKVEERGSDAKVGFEISVLPANYLQHPLDSATTVEPFGFCLS
ncbi:hypothetical protein [Meridianimarinicoccus aquatilis]|uniref:hypothetical protein n=1 Tax=Meridianimarinicoccus aquatilis TaxID=2552766 RepID=UPI001405471C|nr:hypothetical protein [Fluviibacterium aquatile]